MLTLLHFFPMLRHLPSFFPDGKVQFFVDEIFPFFLKMSVNFALSRGMRVTHFFYILTLSLLVSSRMQPNAAFSRCTNGIITLLSHGQTYCFFPN